MPNYAETIPRFGVDSLLCCHVPNRKVFTFDLIVISGKSKLLVKSHRIWNFIPKSFSNYNLE